MARSIPAPKLVATIKNIDALKQWEEMNNKFVENTAAKQVRAHADKVAARAKDLVPVKSGLLQSTIHVQEGRSPLRAVVKTDHGKAPHDFLVHFGTVHNEGHPFLYQANEQLQPDLIAAIKSEFGHAE